MSDLKFDPHATTFSLHNAQLLGQAAAVAYENETSCNDWASGQGFDDFAAFSSAGVVAHTDTQGFIAENNDTVLVAFRGTEPKQRLDWLSDLQIIHEPFGAATGKVHKGFFDALRAVWDHPIQGKKILQERLSNHGGRKVWITGHSLGGALAELCAAQASFGSNVPVQGVYTFGQPRVGDNDFARTVHEAAGARIFRFINDRDVVPRVPFFNMGFRHYGCEIFFDHDEKQTEAKPCIEDLKGALRLARLALRLGIVAEVLKESGLLRNPLAAIHDLAHGREEEVLHKVWKKLLDAGTENITDHDMRKNYLARLGTTLTLKQNA